MSVPVRNEATIAARSLPVCRLPAELKWRPGCGFWVLLEENAAPLSARSGSPFLRVDTWQTGVAVLHEPAEKEVDGRGSDSQLNAKPLSTAFLEPVALEVAGGARIASHFRVPKND